MISETNIVSEEASLHPACKAFHSITKKYLFFHAAFLALAAVEVTLVLLFFSSLVDSFIVGIGIAILFFTALLYFILRLYTSDQKPEEFQKLVSDTLNTQRAPIMAAHHAQEITEKLEQAGAPTYTLFKNLQERFPIVDRFFLKLHQQDIFQIKELFLVAAHTELRTFIALEPLSARGHTLLGKNFLDLARLSEQQKKSDSYRRAILGAIEEFTIVDAYHPGAVETHRELAFCYRSLKKTVQEIHEFEKIVELEPHDHAALFTLGTLYFRTGEKAKGLQVYEKLRNELPEKAAELMQYY